MKLLQQWVTFKKNLIRKLAYWFYIEEGCADGHDLDHWLRSEHTIKNMLRFSIIVILAAIAFWGINSNDARFLFLVFTALFYVFSRENKNWIELPLVFFLIITVGLGPRFLKTEVSSWNNIFKSEFQKGGFEGGYNPGKGFWFRKEPVPISTTTQSGPAEEKPALDFKPDLKQITQISSKNLIKNSDFQIPFTSEFSGWGYGLYSDRFRAASPALAPFWINFLNANIQVLVERTEKGNALKIAHFSKTQDHSVGVMEQYVDAAPGIYRLTFWAKAEADFERGGLQFFITDDWRITDKINPEIKRGFEIEKEGSFEWQQFSGEMQIDSPGKRTFFIVSAKKGTVWVADISLIKISDLET